MLQEGDRVPHINLTTIHGRPFSYASIWQRSNLVVVALPAIDRDAEQHYLAELSEQADAFRDSNTECVATREPVPGLASPAALVADRWGEIVHLVRARDVAGLPSPADLAGWVEAVEHRCPECEGEAK